MIYYNASHIGHATITRLYSIQNMFPLPLSSFSFLLTLFFFTTSRANLKS